MPQVIYLSAGANESDIAAALAMMSSGGTLVLPKDAYIQVHDGINIDIAHRNITIDLNGSTLKQAANVTVLSASGAIGTSQAVTLNTSGANATITYTTAQANIHVGDWIKIAADDILPNDNRNVDQPTRLGQAMQVIAISGNTVALAGEPLYSDQYVTNVRAATLTSGTLKITNGTVDGDQTDGAWLSYLVNVRNAIGVQIDELTVKNGNSMGINLVNNVNATVTDSVAINLRDDTSIGWYGYGVHSAGSLNTTVNGLYAEQVRHATDDNGVGVVAGDPDLSKYGADIGMTVMNSVSYYASAFSYSWHSEGRNGLLDNDMSFYSHGFVGLRGVGNTVQNSASVGDERAFQFFEYGYGDSKNMVINNVTVREAGVYVYNVQGNPTNNLIENSYLEYDYRTGNPGSTAFVNTQVVKSDGVDDDVITGTDGPDRLLGGRGHDLLYGGAGDDYVWGGADADTMTGGAGSDRFVFDQIDSIDTVTDFQAGADGDVIDVSILGARLGWKGDYLANGYVSFAQSGSDTLVQVTSDHITIAVLQNVQASSITPGNVRQRLAGAISSYTTPPTPTTTLDAGSQAYAKGVTITGTASNDYIDAIHSVVGQSLPTIRADTINGGDGDDYIDGLGGADKIIGGNGNDAVVYYGGVKSSLQGGSGRDVLLLNSTDVIDLSASDQSEGLPVVSGFDDVDGRGSSQDLTIYGSSNNNNIWGGAGDDRISGGGGNDRIDGGPGVDIALLDGNRDDYSFIRISDTVWRVQDLRITTGSVRTYFTNMEQVSFNDQLAFIDTLNRPPTDISLSNANISENAAPGTLIGLLTGVDADVSEINTFTILNDPTGQFQISGYNLLAAQPLDSEAARTISLDIQLTDSDSHSIARTFVVTVGDVNDTAPVITSASAVTTLEGQVQVLALAATDADTTGEATTYSIKGGTNDAALFAINNGNLVFTSAPDFENPNHSPNYLVTVVASDGVNTSEQTITVNVGDVNDQAPVITSPASVAAFENQTFVTVLAATDADTTGEATTYSIKPDTGDAGAFAISGTSLVFVNAPDYENPAHAPTYIVTVVASDGTNSSEQIITVDVSDVKAGDTMLGTSQSDSFTFSPALTFDRVDGNDGSDTLTFASAVLGIGANGSDATFDIDRNGTLDFSATNVEHLVVSASDVKVTASLGATAVASGDISWTGTAGSDSFEGSLAGVRLVLAGGDGNDTLAGGALADMLDGGAGNDTLAGGPGDDTYIIDSIGDTLKESANQGYDTVRTSLGSFSLATNFEALVYTGTTAFTGNGNSADNVLTGGSGDDKLDGKAGADTLTGGLGDDTYTVDNIGDVVVENVGAGTDTVKSYIDYTLGANVEKLSLLGTAALNGNGNTLANSITGNAANNQLFGLDGRDILVGGGGNDLLSGGAGADTLTGGTGADVFRFDVLEISANKDTVKDFEHGIDHLEITRAAFNGFAGDPAGALNGAEFALGTAATTAQQHLIYDQNSGTLWYDADGVGGRAQVQLAVFSTKPPLDAGDIIVV